MSLFHREGRNIGLTNHGKLLQVKASKIIQLEEAARVEIAGQKGTLQVVIAGTEILLSHMGLSFCKQVKKKYPGSRFEFQTKSDEMALEKVIRGEVHVAFVTTDIESKSSNGLSSKIIGVTKFQTYVGERHPLFSAAKAGRTVEIDEVLKHTFVSPSNPLFGEVGPKQSVDGWRDDKFLRKVEYLATNLKVLEEIVVNGMSLAYLPDYYCKDLNVKALKISGCPYTCVQKIKIVARNPQDIGWLNQIFSNISNI